MKKLLFTTTLLVSLLAPNQNAITKEPNNHLNKQLIAGGTVATCALASTIYFFYKANSYKKQLLKRPTLTIEEEIKFEKKLKLYKQLAIASGIMAVGGLVIGTYEVWQGKQEKTDQESNSYEEPKQEDQTSGLTPEQIAQIKRALIDVDLGDGQSHIRKKTSRKKREEDQTPTPPSTPENADSPESSQHLSCPPSPHISRSGSAEELLLRSVREKTKEIEETKKQNKSEEWEWKGIPPEEYNVHWGPNGEKIRVRKEENLQTLQSISRKEIHERLDKLDELSPEEQEQAWKDFFALPPETNIQEEIVNLFKITKGKFGKIFEILKNRKTKE